MISIFFPPVEGDTPSLSHFIFLNFLGGGPTNPPQGKVPTHKYSHDNISNPPITNPPNPGIPSYYMPFWQKTRIITQKYVDKINH